MTGHSSPLLLVLLVATLLPQPATARRRKGISWGDKMAWRSWVPTERLCGLGLNQTGAEKPLQPASPCPSDCNSDKGWGRCRVVAPSLGTEPTTRVGAEVAGRRWHSSGGRMCRCAAGRGGAACEFSQSTIFGGHDVWQSFREQRERPRPNVQGWVHTSKALLRRLIEGAGANLIVEVGVWKGAGTLLLADIMRKRNQGVVVSVDTWLGALEFWQSVPYNDKERDLRLVAGYPTVYQVFLSNIDHHNLTGFVVPFPVPSQIAADYFYANKILADAVSVDASHDYMNVCEDITRWWRVLRPGGVMLGDDYMSGWPGVVRAVDDFVLNMNLKFHHVDDEWWVWKDEASVGDLGGGPVERREAD